MSLGATIDGIEAWLLAGAAFVAIVAGCYGAVKWARAQFRDAAVHDVRPVVESAIHASLKPVLAELHPNGGSSLRDSVDRLEEGHDRLNRKLDEAEEWRVLADIQLRNIQQGQIGQ